MITTKTDWKVLADKQIAEMFGGYLEFPVDHRLQHLLTHFPCQSLRAVEFGCWHGWHTATLARHFQHVTAIDIRPDNIAKTLLRLHLLAVKNVEVVLGNVDEFDFQTDVLVHVGVLYHLFNPVAHLHRVLPRCHILCLDTHVNKPSLQPTVEFYDGVPYAGGLYKEHGWKDPLSGIEAVSVWLDEAVLKQVLFKLGFAVVHENHHEAPTGPRLTLVATRTSFV